MDVSELRILSKREAAIVYAIAEALFPPSDVFQKPLSQIRLCEQVDSHLSKVTSLMRLNYRLALWIVEFSLIFIRLKRFSKASLETRTSCWDRLWRVRFYPLKLLLRLLTSVIYLIYYSDAENEAAVGFERRRPTYTPSLPQGSLIDRLEKDTEITTEVCIIGSGAGGAAVARTLAEKGHEVLVLEEGGYFNTNHFSQGPLAVVQQIYHSAGMQATIGLPAIIVPTGRAIGGTTIINSGTCFRLPEAVLESWRADFGLTDLRYQDLIPHFETVEKNLRVGPVTEELQGRHSQLIAKGLTALGYEGYPLTRNAPGCEASGICCFGCPTEAKQSIHLSYIPQALAAGATIYSHCLAKQIIPLGKEGVVIEAYQHHSDPDHCHRLKITSKILVIACGTFNTPRAIKCSRLLPGNRHVGRHFSLHPAGNVKALFAEKVEGWKGVPQGYWMDPLKEEGVTFEGAFTPPGFGSIMSGLPRVKHRHLMEHYDHVAAFGFMLTDHSGGSIWTLPNREILSFYNVKRSEIKRYQKAVAFLVDVFAAAGAKKIYPGLRCLPEVSPEEAGDAVRRLKLRRTDLDLSAFHPLGSCRMGTNESNSVVNSWGRMHRYSNIYIADGSILPSSLGVNPQVTIMTFAHRIADGIHETAV